MPAVTSTPMIRSGHLSYGELAIKKKYMNSAILDHCPHYLPLDSYERYTTSEGKIRYATVGYTTIYLYYAYPQNIRPRISQMLVLPPFQRLGIGSKFIQVKKNLFGHLIALIMLHYLQVVYNIYQGDPKVLDITVEDPSDEFRRIRNVVDAKLCRTLESFAPAKLHAGYNKEMEKEAKQKFKVMFFIEFTKNTLQNVLIFNL